MDPHDIEHRLIRPVGLGDEMVKRLMGRLNPARREPGGHGLHALSLARQKQPRAIGPRRPDPVGMAEHSCDRIEIRHEPLLRGLVLLQARLCHSPNLGQVL
jgi:hypothetical protein